MNPEMMHQSAPITPPFIVLFVLYFAGLVFYLLYAVLGLRWARPLATSTVTLAAIVSLGDLAWRGIEAHRSPTATLTEFTLIMLFSVMALFFIADQLLIRRGTDLAFAGIVLSALSFCVLAFLVFAGLNVGRPGPQTIQPVLISSWRTIHVASAGPGYGGIFLSFAFGLLYLMRIWFKLPEPNPATLPSKRTIADRIPSSESLGRLCYLSVAFAFPFLTILNITGAMWAKSSWGRYWGWDPKEVWGLVTWIIYALYLHMHLVREWRGSKAAWIAVIGFLAMLITLAGVSYLPANSLHKYSITK
jgi:cytochrome c-type biogenesis protein CcsB